MCGNLSQGVLLPAVLTSDTVHNELKSMYYLAQHLVRIVAGEGCLKAYTANTPHAEDNDHPVGIISLVIQNRTKGKPSNLPHKVIQDMWSSRKQLALELPCYGLNDAFSAEASQYSALLAGSKPWQDLVATLKITTLPGGVIMPKRPVPQPGSKAEAVLAAIRRKRSAGGSTRDPPTATTDESHSNVSPDGAKLPSYEGLMQHSRSPSLLIDGILEPVPPANTSMLPSNRSVSTIRSSKRQKVIVAPTPCLDERQLEETSSGREDDNYSDTAANASDQIEPLSSSGKSHALRCHYNAQQQLEQLHDHVLEMEAPNARALSRLLSTIYDIKDQEHFGRVIQTLADKAENYAQRAVKADQAVATAQKDWEINSDD
ncbi:hypothetical protein RSOL_034410, partial [Rhizoctonia solani AG-3 Rhs1AP]